MADHCCACGTILTAASREPNPHALAFRCRDARGCWERFKCLPARLKWGRRR